MNEEELRNWEMHAALALSGKYSPGQISVIIDWFRTIKASDERDLIGQDAIDAMLIFVSAGKFSVYDSLMARLFIYAPLILKKAQND